MRGQVTFELGWRDDTYLTVTQKLDPSENGAPVAASVLCLSCSAVQSQPPVQMAAARWCTERRTRKGAA